MHKIIESANNSRLNFSTDNSELKMIYDINDDVIMVENEKDLQRIDTQSPS